MVGRMAKAKELPAPAGPTDLARVPERWSEKAEGIVEDPLNDFLTWLSGGTLSGAVVAAVLSVFAWAAVLGGVGTALGVFAIRAQRARKAKVRGLIQDALEDQRRTHVDELQARVDGYGRERVALDAKHAQGLADDRAAVLAAWPVRRSITIHHWHSPQVTRSGKITMHLHVINHSPYALRLHTPKFTPFADEIPSDATTEPTEALLAADGGAVDMIVVGMLPQRAITADATHLKACMNGGIAVVRDLDGANERIGVTCAPGGDWVKSVEIK